MTEEQTARYNQSLAAAEAAIDELVRILRAKTAEVGEPQAVAYVCALFPGAGTPELAGLLTAALVRLSRQAAEARQ